MAGMSIIEAFTLTIYLKNLRIKDDNEEVVISRCSQHKAVSLVPTGWYRYTLPNKLTDEGRRVT
jgi:hypothetical protein